MALVEVHGIKKYYKKKPSPIKALDGINLEVEKGEFLSIVGTSGSGKSTLLNIMGGLDKPTEGKVIIDNKDIYSLDEISRTIFRRRNIGFIFQMYNLIPILTVKENILLPVNLDGNSIDKEFLDRILHLLKLEDRMDFMPNELSGGQQQRVAIARALITKPSIILADEPTGNLDSKTSQEVMGLLKLCKEWFNQTIVMITHNEELAQLANRIVRIEDGLIVE